MGSAVDFPSATIDTLAARFGLCALLGFNPTGNVFYVDSNTGASTNDGLTNKSPLATLAQALVKCTDNKGDIINVMPGHAETLATTSTVTTTGLAWTQSGVTVIGGGHARNRPAITCPAADLPGIILSGNNNRIMNLRIVSSASQTSKTSPLIRNTGTDNIIGGFSPNSGNSLEHGSTGGLDAITCTAADRTQIVGNTFLGIGTACQVAIQVKSNMINGLIANNTFNYGVNLLKSAVIFASLGSNCSGTHILNNNCSGIKLKFLDILGSIATNTTAGLCSGNRIGYGATLTLLASTTINPGDMAVMDQHEVDGKRIQPTLYGVHSIHPSSAVLTHAAIMHT